MELTQEAIDELKAIHQRETGEILSDDEAWEMGNRLLMIYDVLTRVDPGDEETKSAGEPKQGVLPL